MDNVKFNALIAEVGMSTADVATVANVTARAVYHWRNGKTDPPISLVMLLKMLAEGKVNRDWISNCLKSTKPTGDEKTT